MNSERDALDQRRDFPLSREILEVSSPMHPFAGILHPFSLSKLPEPTIAKKKENEKLKDKETHLRTDRSWRSKIAKDLSKKTYDGENTEEEEEKTWH